MPDETPQTGDTAQTTDSAPADVPSEAPEAPANAVTPPLAKDDNSAQDVPNGQIPVSLETAQSGEISPANEPNLEPNPAAETPAEAPVTPPETTTAQTVVNEPLGELLKPNVPEPAPTPTPAGPVSPKPNLARQLIAKAREAIQSRKRKKIDHVMDLFAKRTNITNNQVADFLHVSDATATRYLQVLENENRKIGRAHV